MFGTGNEPSTVEEFEALFPLDYYVNNSGTTIGGTVNGFRSIDSDGNTISNLSIPITTLTGVSVTTSEVMFPYGLNGIGGVKDEIEFKREFQELEFIESTGTQYIDTGYFPNQDTKVRITYLYTAISTSTGNVSLGCTSLANESNAYKGLFRMVGGFNRVAFGNGSGTTVTTTGNNSTFTKYTLFFNKNVASINGTTITTFPSSTWSAEYPLYLFVRNNGGNIDNPMTGRIFKCEIWDNTTKVMELIPVRRMSDGMVGMYDVISKSFFKNSGTGAFVAGNVIGEFRVDGGRAVKRIGVVDMGTLNWNYNVGSTKMYFNPFSDAKGASNSSVANILCKNYVTETDNHSNITSYDKIISIGSNKVLSVRDSNYSDATTFKTAMDGVLLYYELDTPIEYSLDAIPSTEYYTGKGGKEMWLPEQSSVPEAAPLDWDVSYGMDVVEEINNKAPLTSPALIGTPTAPTAESGDASTKIATTAFVQGEISTQLGNIEILLAAI